MYLYMVIYTCVYTCIYVYLSTFSYDFFNLALDVAAPFDACSATLHEVFSCARLATAESVARQFLQRACA